MIIIATIYWVLTMHQKLCYVLHIHYLNRLKMLWWCGLMRKGTHCGIEGAFASQVTTGMHQLKNYFIRISHRRTFHYKDSSSELYLPSNSKVRIFEIDSECSLWNPEQKAWIGGSCNVCNLEWSPYSDPLTKTAADLIAALPAWV